MVIVLGVSNVCVNTHPSLMHDLKIVVTIANRKENQVSNKIQKLAIEILGGREEAADIILIGI